MVRPGDLVVPGDVLHRQLGALRHAAESHRLDLDQVRHASSTANPFFEVGAKVSQTLFLVQKVSDTLSESLY